MNDVRCNRYKVHDEICDLLACYDTLKTALHRAALHQASHQRKGDQVTVIVIDTVPPPPRPTAWDYTGKVIREMPQWMT